MITVVSCIVIFMRRAQRKKVDSPNVINALTVGIINMEQEILDIPNTTKQPHLPYDDLVVEGNSNPVLEHVYGVINQPRS